MGAAFAAPWHSRIVIVELVTPVARLMLLVTVTSHSTACPPTLSVPLHWFTATGAAAARAVGGAAAEGTGAAAMASGAVCFGVSSVTTVRATVWVALRSGAGAETTTAPKSDRRGAGTAESVTPRAGAGAAAGASRRVDGTAPSAVPDAAGAVPKEEGRPAVSAEAPEPKAPHMITMKKPSSNVLPANSDPRARFGRGAAVEAETNWLLDTEFSLHWRRFPKLHSQL